MYDIVQHDHADELLALSGAYLEKRESENNLPLGLAHTLARDPYYFGDDPPLLLSILDSGDPVGVAVRSPPHRIVLSIYDTEIDGAVDRLVQHLQNRKVRVPGVVGPETEARCFCSQWIRTSPGCSAIPRKRLRAFESRSVIDVPLAPGSLRLAETADQRLMARWIAAFSREATGEEPDPEKADRNAMKYIAERNLYIWEDDGPVSIARQSRAMKNGTNVTMVYTPDALRNRGYATSCVYALTRKLLADRYSFCSLFTDLSNPASNRIYQKIGYVPLGDWLEFDFDCAVESADC
ncbi:MAG: GNAT family N-acetyltransferase [Gemmatimonadetes bacterium]|nr:GNAT family N-acetyltransferase [Gemmatimonadota bacterium]